MIEARNLTKRFGDIMAVDHINATIKDGSVFGLVGTNLAQTKGVLNVNTDGDVMAFREKKDEDAALINGGFMIMEPGIFDYIDGDDMMDYELLRRLAELGQVKAYHHDGFWQCMDTQREKKKLDEMCRRGDMPWKVW